MCEMQDSVPGESHPIPPEARRALSGLLEASALWNAPRVQALLQYFADAVLNGWADDVNEQRIGEQVFSRREGYNPSEDSIVRVTVKNLRTRLDKYYAAEGAGEHWVLEIRKGKYAPVLHPRELSDILPVIAGRAGFLTGRWPWVLLGVVLGSVLFLAVSLMLRSGPSPATPPSLIQELFSSAKISSAFLVLSDANLNSYRRSFGKLVPLDAYLERSWVPPRPPHPDPFAMAGWGTMQGKSLTTFSSAIVTARLQRAVPEVELVIRHPQEVTMQDFRKSSLIVVSNPWALMLEEQLNFRTVLSHPEAVPATSSENGMAFRNLKPSGDEAQVFQPHQEGNFLVNYARLAVLPNLGNTGRVFVLGATAQSAMDALSNFLAQPSSTEELKQRLGRNFLQEFSSLEVVLAVRSVTSAPERTQIVATRINRRSSR